MLIMSACALDGEFSCDSGRLGWDGEEAKSRQKDQCRCDMAGEG